MVVLHGGMGARSRRPALARLAAIPADEERLILATGRRMFERRLRGYRSIGYARGEAPLGLAEDTEEVSIEADSSKAVSAEDDLSD